jgi:hypothetical protein
MPSAGQVVTGVLTVFVLTSLSLSAWAEDVQLVQPFEALHQVALVLFGSQAGVRIAFCIAWSIHLGEAMAAAYIASQNKKSPLFWGSLTFVFGFLVLTALLRSNKNKKS